MSEIRRWEKLWELASPPVSSRKCLLILAAWTRIITARFPCADCQPILDSWNPDTQSLLPGTAQEFHSDVPSARGNCLLADVLLKCSQFTRGIVALQETWSRLADFYLNANDRLRLEEYRPHWGNPEKLPALIAAQSELRLREWRDCKEAVRDVLPAAKTPQLIDATLLTWRDATIPKLAQAAYDERELPSGLLDGKRLAILADALEESGCTNEDVLAHLRGAGPHVRGCWVVDLLLGRE